MRGARTMVRVGVVVCVLAAATVALAAARLPKPGTASQVATLVHDAPSVTSLPTDLLPPLSQVSADNAATYYGVAGRECWGMSKCVFGDRSSPETVVLFGDSHAQMWLPALSPALQAAKVRLVLIWRPGCPPTDIGVWDMTSHSIDKGCTAFRTAMIAAIRKAKPALVLLADRTSDIPGANNKLTTNAAWQAGLEETISELKSPTTKVAVIGDITVFSLDLPACLSAYPSDVQKCSVQNPNLKTHQHFAAERAAASAEGVTYLDPQPWLCTTICSPVIGTMAAYYDKFHVSATYAEYLSGVWATALKPLLGT